MGSCREVLTLQLGSYANYVGSHWWSLQDMGFSYSGDVKSELCHDVLYREGSTINGEVTFTPRVLCVERATQLTPIPILENPSTISPVLWDPSRVENIDVPKEKLHPFIEDLDAGIDTTKKDYEFESSVRGWGDLLRTRLHPRSIVAGYQKLEEDLEDRIRHYVEECDNIQGFQILIDSSDSFSEVLSFLDDEFSTKPRMAFPLVEGVGELNWRDSATRFVRTFLSFHETATLASLSIPLSCVNQLSLKPETPRIFPNLSYELKSKYHTTAIIASFLDTISLTYRTSANPTAMSDVLSGLTANGWKFSAASLALPFPMLPGNTLQQCLEARNDETPLLISTSPGVATEGSWYQKFGFRGVPDGGVLLNYLQYLSSAVTTVSSVSAAMPTSQPFPKIFSKHVSMRGSVDPSASRMPDFEVNSAPVMAGLHACPGMGGMLDSITSIASKIDLRRLSHIDIEMDLYQDGLSAMTALASVQSMQFDID